MRFFLAGLDGIAPGLGGVALFDGICGANGGILSSFVFGETAR